MTDYLLDTCAVIWTAQGDPLHEPGASELPKAYERGTPLLVSPFTAWEVAMLVSKGRLALALNPDLWFQRFCDLPWCHSGGNATVRTGSINNFARSDARRSRRSHTHRNSPGVRVRPRHA